MALFTRQIKATANEVVTEITGEWHLDELEHTHYHGVTQLNVSIDGKSCPVDVVVTILNKLANNQFSAGIARVEGPLYRQMREPRAAAQVIISLCKRLGLTLGEYRPARGFSRELGEFTFIGHRNGPWRSKAQALTNELNALLALNKKSNSRAR